MVEGVPPPSRGEAIQVPNLSEMDRWKTLQQGISHTLELKWSGQMELLQLAASHTLEMCIVIAYV